MPWYAHSSGRASARAAYSDGWAITICGSDSDEPVCDREETPAALTGKANSAHRLGLHVLNDARRAFTATNGYASASSLSQAAEQFGRWLMRACVLHIKTPHPRQSLSHGRIQKLAARPRFLAPPAYRVARLQQVAETAHAS